MLNRAESFFPGVASGLGVKLELGAGAAASPRGSRGGNPRRPLSRPETCDGSEHRPMKGRRTLSETFPTDLGLTTKFQVDHEFR